MRKSELDKLLKETCEKCENYCGDDHEYDECKSCLAYDLYKNTSSWIGWENYPDQMGK